MYYAGIEKKTKSKGVLKGNKESSQGKRRQSVCGAERAQNDFADTRMGNTKKREADLMERPDRASSRE